VESTNRRKSRFSEERIVALLKQAGECRRFGCPRLSLLLRREGLRVYPLEAIDGTPVIDVNKVTWRR
jgi:hypothetical protein